MKYMGRWVIIKQLEYDKPTGELTKWHVQPYNKVDEIAAYHEIAQWHGKEQRGLWQSDDQIVRQD